MATRANFLEITGNLLSLPSPRGFITEPRITVSHVTWPEQPVRLSAWTALKRRRAPDIGTVTLDLPDREMLDQLSNARWLTAFQQRCLLGKLLISQKSVSLGGLCSIVA